MSTTPMPPQMEYFQSQIASFNKEQKRRSSGIEAKKRLSFGVST